jgi:hypothetical protein
VCLLKTLVASIIVIVVLLIVMLPMAMNEKGSTDTELEATCIDQTGYIILSLILVTSVLAVLGIELHEIRSMLKECREKEK